MQQPDEKPVDTNETSEDVAPTSLDKAEADSKEAWDNAGKAVGGLKKLGHEEDDSGKP